jgi:vitamin B12 transporter
MLRYLVWLLCLISFGIGAQRPDTVVFLPVSMVEERRLELPAGAREWKLDSAWVSRQGQPGLGQALAFATGAHYRNYGPGLLGSFSFRGTGAERSLTVWNSVPLIQNGVGQLDFSLIQPSPSMRISLQPGAAGASYGSGAIGAVIHLNFEPDFIPRRSVSAHAFNGSFGNFGAESEVLLQDSVRALRISLNSASAHNRFTYPDLSKVGAPLAQQEHADYALHTLMADYFQRGKTGVWGFQFWGNTGQRSLPPSMGAAYNGARQEDLSLRFRLSWEKILSPALLIKSQVAWIRDYLHYTSEGVDSRALQSQWLAQTDMYWTLRKNIDVSAGFQWLHYVADQNSYSNPSPSEARPSLYARLNYSPFKQHRFTYQIRQQWAAVRNVPLVGQFGYTGDLMRKNVSLLQVNAQIASHYRIPTFNDLYWNPGGNPELNPEEGWHAEAGLRFLNRKPGQKLDISITAYLSRINDWIRWLPGAQGIWSPDNIVLAFSRGLEGYVAYSKKFGRVSTSAHLRVNLNLAEDLSNGNFQLPYAPRWLQMAHFSIAFKGISLLAEQQLSDVRYTQTDEGHFLPAFQLVNLHLSYELKLRKHLLAPYLRIENVANTRYMAIRNYALPGRFFRAGILWRLNNW